MWFILLILLVVPYGALATGDIGSRTIFLAEATTSFLSPDFLFNSLRESIVIPAPDQNVEIPPPQETLRRASPKLQEINRDVKEEVGVDFAKLFSWLAKILKVLFQFFVEILESLSRALDPGTSN